MVPEEATWLRRTIEAFPAAELSPLVNVGSSTRWFRQVKQPYIEREIFAPLTDRGVTVLHCDAKPDEGVDIVGDALDDDCIRRIAAARPKAVLCSNMFEHVEDPARLAAALSAVVPPNGLLLVTVPLSFPYHPDPIDRMFRPTPQEVAALFPGWGVVASAVVSSPGFHAELRRDLRRRPYIIAKHVVRAFMPFYKPKYWVAACHMWLWAFRDFAITCIALRRPAADGQGK